MSRCLRSSTNCTRSVSGLQWVVASYALVIASLLMLAGSTADRFGRRRTFQTGLACSRSARCCAASRPSLGALVAFRMVQAIGGSMLNPVAMSIITNTFTERRERARAIGIWGGVVGLSPWRSGRWSAACWSAPSAGAASSGSTSRSASRRSCSPRVFVPESKAPRARRFDPVGQLLVMITLATLVYGIIEGPAAAGRSPLIIACFAVAAAAGTSFAWYEIRRRDALLDVRFFRSAPFAGATVIAVSAFAGWAGSSC